jgi:hypothetical protein
MAGIVQEFSRIVQPAARTSGHRPFGRPMLRAHEQTDLAARLPPELAFLVAEGFPPERLLNALGSEPKAVRPVDKLLSEGLISEETYYRALARHLGCEYYNGEPPLAGAFDAICAATWAAMVHLAMWPYYWGKTDHGRSRARPALPVVRTRPST